jgi:hypothetical protein
MNSDMLLYATAELAVLLLCICAALIFHVRNLKKLIKRLEAKVLELRETIAATKQNAKSKIQEIKNNFQEKTYLEYIDEHIELTREHHASQSPDRDIVLDLDTDIPEERQIAALRHAFLVMEKEAQYASEDDAAMVWPVIRAKLQQIIHFYRTAFQGAGGNGNGPSEPDEMLLQELQNYKQRVENLDRFKKLFFDMEKQWNAARKEAEQYRAQLLEMTQGLENAGAIEDVLNQYSNAYNDLQNFIDSGADLADGGTGEVVRKRETASVEITDERKPPETKVIITHQDEIVRLRKMMVEQHNIIAGLKQKLRESDTTEDKLAAVDQLSRELDKQERMMRESETCIKLLEDELEQMRTQLHTLEQENNELRGNASQQSEKEVQEMIASHVAESRDMMSSLAQLEKENRRLREELAAGGGGGGSGDFDDAEAERLRTKLAEVQQELLNLQTQHIELEERYIELKTTNMR